MSSWSGFVDQVVPVYAVIVELVDRAGDQLPDPVQVRSEVDQLVIELTAAGVEHVATVGSESSRRVTVFVRATDHASAETLVRRLLSTAAGDESAYGWTIPGDAPGT